MNRLVVLCVVMVMCSTSVSARKCRFSLTDYNTDDVDDDYIETQCIGSCLKMLTNSGVNGLFIHIITSDFLSQRQITLSHKAIAIDFSDPHSLWESNISTIATRLQLFPFFFAHAQKTETPLFIFAGFLWRGGVKRQWGNRKRRFSWLSDATSSAP